MNVEGSPGGPVVKRLSKPPNMLYWGTCWGARMLYWGRWYGGGTIMKRLMCADYECGGVVRGAGSKKNPHAKKKRVCS